MSEEEIIKMLEHSIDTYIEDTKVTKVELTTEQAQVLLDLYNKQKELLQGKLFENYQYYKDLASSYQANCISKDKIRDKIKELEEYQKQHKEGNWSDIPIEDYDFDKINLLKELLEE